jgi:hypothetical protein
MIGSDEYQCLLQIDHPQRSGDCLVESQRLENGPLRQVLVESVVNPPAFHLGL